MPTDTTCELRSPESPEEWEAYHAIRRRVLFERRGRSGVYDAHHPDEHRPGHHPKILIHEGQIIGVVRIDIAPPQAIFRRVAVREDYQRRGYGRQLIRLAETFALEQSCPEVLSFVDQAATGFYQKCGFVEVTELSTRSSTAMSKRPQEGHTARHRTP